MMTAEQAWNLFHEELERVCWQEHVQNPETPNDDRPIIPERAMRLIFMFAWRKAEETT